MFDRQPRGAFRAPQVTQRQIRATVKWYNSSKGFGFVTPEDGSPDAFLHVSAVQAAGHDALRDGTTIICDLAQGARGPQVATIHSVDATTAAPARAPRPPRFGADAGPAGGGFGARPRRDDRADFGGGETVEGTVKWFNEAKGFGFIAPESGGKDVFVHASALQRSGLTALAEGEAVRAVIRVGPKGPEAERIEIL